MSVRTSSRIAAQMVVRLRLFAVAFLFTTLLSLTAGAQRPSPDRTLDQLRSADVSHVAAAIEALHPELLQNDRIVEQLVLLLDDRRVAMRHSTHSETVQQLARLKLWVLDRTGIRSITNQLSKLSTDYAIGLALESIARIGEPNADVYPQILDYCRHNDPFVRSRAIAALSTIAEDDAAIVTQLAEFLGDKDPMVRWTVLDCLSDRPTKIGGLVPKIGRLLDDEAGVYIAISNHAFVTRKLRSRAARLLGAIGPDAVETLPKLERLLSETNDVNVRVWSAAAICAIHDTPPPETLGLLGDLLLSDVDDEWTENEAIDAIAELGRRAMPLIDHLEQAKNHRSAEIRSGVAEAFFAVHPESAIGRILPLVSDKDELVAQSAIKTLSDHGAKDQSVIDAYIRALDNSDGIFDQPANAAVDALMELGVDARSAIPALKRLADDAETSDTLRDDALRAITAISQSSNDNPGKQSP